MFPESIGYTFTWTRTLCTFNMSYFDTFLKEMLMNFYYGFSLIDSSHLSTVTTLYFSPSKKAKPKQIKPKYTHTETLPQNKTEIRIKKQDINKSKCPNKAKWDLKSKKCCWVCFVLENY